MADNRWLGKAAGVKQVDTVTIANNWATNDTITLTIDGVDFIVTIGSVTTTTGVATTLKQAFMNETLTDTTAAVNVVGGATVLPQFADITASVTGSVVTFTQNSASYTDKPGKPWTMTCTESTAGTGTATLANVTTPTGKHHANNADNWSNGAVPVDDDVVIFDSGAVDCLYALSLACQPASVVITRGFTGKIGLAPINSDTSGKPYREYRTRYLTFDDNSVNTSYLIGQGDGQGSTRINIDHGAGQATITVYGLTGRDSASPNVPPVCMKGSHTATSLINLGGDVGYCHFTDEAGHLASIYNGYGGTGPSQNKTVIGTDVNLGDAVIVCNGGNLETNSATSTSSSIVVNGGEMVAVVGGQLTVTVNKPGVYKHRAAGTTIGTITVSTEGKFVKETPGTLTVTNPVQLHKNAEFLAPDGNVTLSGGIKLNHCRWGDVKVDVGTNKTYSLS